MFGREILLGVGGGIAAYKSCDLLRRLQDRGYLVTVVPTPSSLNFVGSATWEALSGRKVHTQVWENIPEVPHVALADKAQMIVIAPATADLIARIAQGRADDLLTNIVLASDAPKLIVPAMHPNMWLNAATVANVATLRSRGFIVLEPEVGRLTGKDSGVGRFPETAVIIEEVEKISGWNADLLGKEILITAGGTREPIDAVRYIGNRSSGKQGYALAEAAVSRGAKVKLIAANCNLPDIDGVEIFPVATALEMGALLQDFFPASDALIMSAAVADVRPSEVSDGKIKKEKIDHLDLIANPDLLAQAGKARRADQVLVGFAAETSNLEEYAAAKLERKGLDLLYVNDVSGGAIFGSTHTQGMILDKSGVVATVPESTKETLAHKLLDLVATRLS
ncbi:MAG: bifunctional phosphopantothenoylcysteine decarboxylase/phosphopantothenate--cysteine ligase CoaBC [Actinomycetes bacterium]